MLGHAALVTVWAWWRGTWLGRIAMFQIIWGTFALSLMISAPHPEGVAKTLILFNLAASGIAAWLLAALPMYFRGPRFTAGSAWRFPVPRRIAAGSMARRDQAVKPLGRSSQQAPRAPLRLPR